MKYTTEKLIHDFLDLAQTIDSDARIIYKDDMITFVDSTKNITSEFGICELLEQLSNTVTYHDPAETCLGWYIQANQSPQSDNLKKIEVIDMLRELLDKDLIKAETYIQVTNCLYDDIIKNIG